MNIIQQKMQTFKITDRFIDLFLLFISARLAIIAERVLHYKSWHALDSQSFHFSALFIIFFIWRLFCLDFIVSIFYQSVPEKKYSNLFYPCIFRWLSYWLHLGIDISLFRRCFFSFYQDLALRT